MEFKGCNLVSVIALTTAPQLNVSGYGWSNAFLISRELSNEVAVRFYGTFLLALILISDSHRREGRGISLDSSCQGTSGPRKLIRMRLPRLSVIISTVKTSHPFLSHGNVNSGLMQGQRVRRWPDIYPESAERLDFAGMSSSKIGWAPPVCRGV